MKKTILFLFLSVLVMSTLFATGGDDFATATNIGVLPYADTGDTSAGFTNIIGNTSADAFYVITSLVELTGVTMDLTGSSYDTYIRVFDADQSTQLWGDDDGGAGTTSKLSGLTLSAGNSYYICVEGYSSNTGAYTLSVTADQTGNINNASAPGAITNALPANGAANQTTTTTLSWDFGANTETYDLYFGTDNPPATMIVDDAEAGASGSYDPGTLSSTTTYYWQIISRNTATRLETVSAVYSFSIAAGAVTSYPYNEQFDVWTPVGYTTSGSQSWATYASGGTPLPSAFCAFWNWSSGTATFETLPFNATGITPALSFDWSHQYNGSYPNDALEVSITTDAGANWTQIWYATDTALDSNDGAGSTTPGTFATEIVSLSAYANTTFSLRFDGTSGYGPNLYIDNLNVIDNSAPPAVTTLVAPADAAADQLADGTLEWNAVNFADGYDLYFGTDNPPTNVVNGADQGTALTYAYRSLTAGATYYWQVVPYNTNGDAVSAPVWSFVIASEPPSPVALIAPADGATNQSLDPTLSWNADALAEGYYINFGTDNPPTDIETMTDNGTATTYAATGLTGDTTYYWQVIPYNVNGNAAACPIWSFTTYQSVVTIFPYTQSFDDATVPVGWTVDPIVSSDSWEVGNSELGGHGATAEHTGNGGYMMVIDDSSPETVPAHLYSQDFDFTGMTAPVLSFWYWIGDGSNTSELHIDVITGTGTDASVDVFTDATGTLGWQQATVSLGAYAGETVSFDFRGMESSSYLGDISLDDIYIFDNTNPPSVTTLVSPADGATDVALSGSLEWNAVGYTDGYDLYFGSDNPPTDVVNGVDQGTTLAYPYSGLSTGTVYYWQVVPYNANGDALSCPVWTFETTSSVPDPVVGPSPLDGATNVSSFGSLDWDPSALADGYYLSFGTDNPPTTLLDGSDIGTDLTYAYSGLAYSTMYYWQVIPYNAAGNADSCPIWSFTVEPDPRLTTPYYQNFDTSTSLPNKWTGNMAVRSSWGRYGSNVLYKNLWSSAPTCAIELENMTGIGADDYVSLYYRIVNYSGAPNNATTLGEGDGFVLEASTNNGDEYVSLYTVNNTNHTTSNQYVQITAPLGSFVGNDVKFRISGAWASGDWYLLIDNFFVGQITPNVVISEVNAGATQYVELYNAGTVPASLNGWSLQQQAPAATTTIELGIENNLPGDFLLYPGRYVAIVGPSLVDFMVTYPTYSGYYIVDGDSETGAPQMLAGSWFILDDGLAKAPVDQFGSGTGGATPGTIYERNDAESAGSDVATDWTPVLAPTPGQENENPIQNDMTLPVELTSFAATTMTSNNDGTYVNLQWTVESENHMSGYNVYRSDTESIDDIYQINSGIIVAVNEFTTHSYNYDDNEVYTGDTFNYWLESISIDGISQFFGPVAITVDEDGDGPDTPEIQKVTAIQSIFPNPFNPSTSVSFSLKEESKVKVNVYNVKGELVSKLADAIYPAGADHKVVWTGLDRNGKNCGSGIYFFKMEAKGYTAVKKAVLVK